MKSIRDILVLLSQRVSSFGRSDESIDVINSAIEENSWFTRHDICCAMEAIREEMLDGEKLDRWLSHYPPLPWGEPRRVAIIMAGNIPLVGFFDLLCTLIAGNQAWIKPSSKDRILMEYICRVLSEIEPSIPIYMYDQSLKYDALIATGGDDANRYFESKFRDTHRICRSSRHSIAILTKDSSSEQMEGLAKDIYSYSGLGCRNVSMIFVPRGMKLALRAHTTTANYRDNYIHTKALMTLANMPFEDNGSLVMITSREFPPSLSTISVWEYDTLSQVEQWIEDNDEKLQCIVSQGEIEHPRRVQFGETQRPTLFDYADGVDTMRFFCSPFTQ